MKLKPPVKQVSTALRLRARARWITPNAAQRMKRLAKRAMNRARREMGKAEIAEHLDEEAG